MIITAHILTRTQEAAGFVVEDDEHIVTLKFNGTVVGTYSAYSVTVETLRHDADTWMNGIEFARR